MADRKRRPRKQRIWSGKRGWVNPYPAMSGPEARIRLALEELQVPFSWRLFDGVSPTTTALIPNFAPEFTLREYNTVIMVQSTFFGTLPAVLDRVGLAQATLEADGWKVLILWDVEINTQPVHQLFAQKAPWLLARTHIGAERPNPYQPNLMEKFREHLRRLNFARSKPGVKKGSIRDRRSERESFRLDTRRGVRLGSTPTDQERQRDN